MCGFVGYTGHKVEYLLSKMIRCVDHRGPDGSGLYEDAEMGVFLAHARLSILDVRGGVQPMSNPDESIFIVFNGEIYNHSELRLILEQDGITFKTDHSDTEVLLKCYEKWGVDCLGKLNGMYSFAIYDRRYKKIFIARDRFGEKPLYYALVDDNLIFGSELDAITKDTRVKDTISVLSIKKYFAYGYIPAPYTVYEGINKLQAGHYLEFDLVSSKLKINQHYIYEISEDESFYSRDEDDIAEELNCLLLNSTKLRIQADRPLGIFLSGGLDSSAVLTCVSELVDDKSLIETFSIGFSDPRFDESNFARSVAIWLGVNHNQKILDINDAKNVVDTVLGSLDEPMADSSILPTYLLAKFAREKVVVALGGDGSDELFAGYGTFQALNPALKYKKFVSNSIQSTILGLVNKLKAGEGYLSIDFKLKRFLFGIQYEKSMWNPMWMAPLKMNEISELLSLPCSIEEVYSDSINAWETSKANDIIGKSSEFFVKFYLQNDILTKLDRATMMVGLEARSPFLDNAVVDFASRLPSKFKMQKGKGKYILRKAMNKRLPPLIMKRPKKGFAIPLTAWMKNWSYDDKSNHLLNINQDTVDKKRMIHKKGISDERLFLWSLIVLQKFFENKN